MNNNNHQKIHYFTHGVFTWSCDNKFRTRLVQLEQNYPVATRFILILKETGLWTRTRNPMKRWVAAGWNKHVQDLSVRSPVACAFRLDPLTHCSDSTTPKTRNNGEGQWICYQAELLGSNYTKPRFRGYNIWIQAHVQPACLPACVHMRVCACVRGRVCVARARVRACVRVCVCEGDKSYVDSLE